MNRIRFILAALLCVCLLGGTACRYANNAINAEIGDVAPAKTPADVSFSDIASEAPSEQPSVKGRAIYGENTSTSDTYTGLAPLAGAAFKVSDPHNTAGLSEKSVDHYFGIAENGIVHRYSREFQESFDAKGYDAVVYDNKTQEKVIYLTFDCGYENGYTAVILDTLKNKNVPAAFFCTLHEVESNPELIARMILEGHIVGNHSVSHADFSTLSRVEMAQELQGFDDHLRTQFGYSSPYFRFPQGKYSECAVELVNSLGYTCMFWSLAYADWDTAQQNGADYAFAKVTAQLHPGAVILLHSVSADNAAAMGDIIDYARAQGYVFGHLDSLMTGPAAGS